jgi:hypothetical protein
MEKLQNKTKTKITRSKFSICNPYAQITCTKEFIRGKTIDELSECSFVWIPFTKFQIPPTLMKTNQTQR